MGETWGEKQNGRAHFLFLIFWLLTVWQMQLPLAGKYLVGTSAKTFVCLGCLQQNSSNELSRLLISLPFTAFTPGNGDSCLLSQFSFIPVLWFFLPLQNACYGLQWGTHGAGGGQSAKCGSSWISSSSFAGASKENKGVMRGKNPVQVAFLPLTCPWPSLCSTSFCSLSHPVMSSCQLTWCWWAFIFWKSYIRPPSGRDPVCVLGLSFAADGKHIKSAEITTGMQILMVEKHRVGPLTSCPNWLGLYWLGLCPL